MNEYSTKILFSIFYIHKRLPFTSTLFPYTTLFRSLSSVAREPAGRVAPGLYLPVRTPWAIGDHTIWPARDRKSTRLNSSHVAISYAVFCLKKKKHNKQLLYS